MDSLKQADGFYMQQYSFLLKTVHLALRQLVYDHPDEARKMLSEGLAEVEDIVLLIDGKEAGSADMDAIFRKAAKKTSGKRLKKEASSHIYENMEPLEFYKKQYAKLLSALDEVITRIHNGDYSGARLHAATTMGEAEEAYIQSGVFSE